MKISFHSHDMSPEYLLWVYKKMTPNQSGIWKDMEAVTSPHKADVHIIIDDCHLKLPNRPRIYLGAHPPGTTSYGDIRSRRSDTIKVIDQSEELGFCEWWLKYDYDYLSNLERETIEKDNLLTCILSDSNDRPYHNIRRKYVEKLCRKKILDNVYGRIKPFGFIEDCYRGELGTFQYNQDASDRYWFGKEEVLEKAWYSLEFDAYPTLNYISERVFDSVLSWCIPLYWGSTNIHEYLPEGSFYYIDAEGKGDDVLEIIREPIRDSALREARDLMLNKYQLWPKIYEVLNR